MDIASLGIRVDSSQVDKATDSLAAFKAEAQQVFDRGKKLTDTLDQSGQKFEGFSSKARNALLSIAGANTQFRGAFTLFSEMPLAFTAGAAAVGVLVKAYVDGANESDNFARAIAATGNAAGYVKDRLIEMSEHIDGVVGTQRNAAAALATFASSGKIAADSLEHFATVAIKLERSVGTPIAETAKRFAALAEDPVKAAAELQKSFNFLTPAVYDYIRAQVRAGDVAGAAATAQNAYAGAAERAAQQVEGELNILGKSWQFVKDKAGEAWDAMAGIGRTQSIAKQIEELQAARDRALARGFSTAGIDVEIASLHRLDAEQQKHAKNLAENKAATDAYVESQQTLTAGIDDLIDAQKRINQAWAQYSIGDIDRGLKATLAKYDSFGDELEALRKANLVDDQHYFSSRRNLIQKSADAEIAALRQVNVELGKQDDLSSVERIAAQNKIADNNERIKELQIRANSQLNVSDIERDASLKKTVDAYLDAQAAADRYVQTLIKQYQIESEGLGLGEKERQRMRDRAQLESRFEDRRQSLDRDLRRGDITKSQYDDLLKIETDALQKSEDAYDKYYADLQAKQGSWLVGVKEGLQNFLDESQNVAGQVSDAIQHGMEGAADAVARFAVTGKGSFGDLTKSIIEDLIRIEARIMLSNLLSSLFGAFAAGGGGTGSAASQILNARNGGFVGSLKTFGRASGGPVTAGQPYIIGEQGPELMVPERDGYVVPNGAMGGVQIHQTNYFSAGMSQEQIALLLKQNKAQTIYEVSENQRRGRWKWARQ